MIRISTVQLFFLLLSVNTLSAQSDVSIPADDTTIVYSKLASFNTYAKAAGVNILSESEFSNITHLRLWGTLSHSFAARFLDIRIKSDEIVGKWYATWVDNSRPDNQKELFEKWNCISDIQTVTGDFGPRSGCLIAEADSDKIRHIQALVFETDFIELLNQPLDKRVQLDGKSLHVEILNQQGYRFVSFMNYHIENHPEKELIGKARSVLNLWQNSSSR